MPELTHADHAEGLQRTSNVHNHNTEAPPTPMPIIQHHLAKHFVVDLRCLPMLSVALPCAVWKKREKVKKSNSSGSSRIAQRSAASLSTEGVVEGHRLEKMELESSKVCEGEHRKEKA